MMSLESVSIKPALLVFYIQGYEVQEDIGGWIDNIDERGVELRNNLFMVAV